MNDIPEIAILIPAAGASSRMNGIDKLQEQVNGQALLAHQAQMALGTGSPVLVTLPPDRPGRQSVLNDICHERLEIVTVQDASEGIAASIRIGAIWALEQGVSGLMIVLADMPDLEESDLREVIQAFDYINIIRGTDVNYKPGHPVVFPARMFEKLAQIQGDNGARSVMQGEAVQYLPLPTGHATTDLDTPEEWAAWRQKTGR